jgi:low affinity Fe/Cu permease
MICRVSARLSKTRLRLRQGHPAHINALEAHGAALPDRVRTLQPSAERTAGDSYAREQKTVGHIGTAGDSAGHIEPRIRIPESGRQGVRYFRWAGSPIAFGIAVIIIVAWVVSGPLFHYSDGWQLVINTGTTIVTFLMVFLIQQSANKDSVAVHLKLNELIASHRQANNLLIGIEDATETDLRRIAEAYARIAAQSMPAAADEPELQSEVERRIEKAQSSEAKPT